MDLNLIRKEPETVKASQRARFREESAIDDILKLDALWREGTDLCLTRSFLLDKLTMMLPSTAEN
jgi:hypothetical protein